MTPTPPSGASGGREPAFARAPRSARPRRGATALAGLAWAGLATGAAGQTVVQWSGGPGQPGPIFSHPQAGGAPAALLPGFEAAELLELDFAGRTRLERFLPDRPRREVEAPGIAKLVLPQGRGSLFHYRRAAAGQSWHGYLHVGPDGQARVALEQPSLGSQDPFSARVGISTDGARLLAATVLGAGGDLFDVELATGVVALRTEAQPPLEFAPESLGYGADFLVAVGSGSVWRAPLQASAQVERLDFPAGTLDVEGGVVFSGDRSTAATIAGSGPQQRCVFSFGSSGPLAQASGQPAPLTGTGAGLASGPHLALSFDGALAAYRFATPVARDVAIAATGAAALAPQVLTGDSSFSDTLDEVGILRFLPGGGLQLAVGETDTATPQGIDSLDLYRIDLGAGIPTVTNLTLSSGDASLPFSGASQIDPEDGLFAVPGSDELLLHDGKGELLLRVGPSGTSVLADAVKQLDAAAWTGSRFALSIVRNGAPDRRQILTVGSAGPALVLYSLASSVELPRFAAGPGELLGARVVQPAAGELFVRLDAGTGQALALVPQLALFDTSFGFTADGTLLGSVAPSLAPGLFFGWPQAGLPTGYFTPPVPGVWLAPF